MNQTGAFFPTIQHLFTLHGREVAWRPPQLGALGALLAHWSLGHRSSAVVSVPTGSGKTAIALAAPFLQPKPAQRVLIVVPSQALRAQIVQAAQDLRTLADIGAWPADAAGPRVLEVTGRVSDWSKLLEYDVVVALPASISPGHYVESAAPPSDLFDMIIIDEAHHAPAPTWQAILDHFQEARSVLLTATPVRRDGKRLPGELLYHYPLRQALSEGFYKPVLPTLVDVDAGASQADVDARMVAEVVALAARPEHGTSVVLVRAATRSRLQELIARYSTAGLEVTPLHGGLSPAQQTQTRQAVAEGGVRAVGVVDMLGEGFDLPSLRILAYHDKHRSLPATLQIIGRLARVSDKHPQPSVLVTPRDADVYPHLRGAVRALYDEDPDWAELLPGLIDDELAEEHRDRAFVDAFDASFGPVAVERLRPMLRASIVEVADPKLKPTFSIGGIPEDLQPGEAFAGGRVLHAGIDSTERMLVVVVGHQPVPRWSADPALVGAEYELGIASYRQSTRQGEPSLGFVNAASKVLHDALLDAIAPSDRRAIVDPSRVSRYLDGLDRASVSAVGMRNTNAANRGTTSYRTNMGGGVDRALRTIEVSRAALGHVNLQVHDGSGATTNGGAALERGKIWITRHVPLRAYDDWIDDLAARLSNSRTGNAGPLLPTLNRGSRLEEWPEAQALAAEMDPISFARGWSLELSGRLVPIEQLQLFVADDLEFELTGHPQDEALPVVAAVPDSSSPGWDIVWRGQLHLDGRVSGDSVNVHRGFSSHAELSDLLEHYPPTVYFLDGTTTYGSTRYPRPIRQRAFRPEQFLVHDWHKAGVDITSEIDRSAAKGGRGTSVLAGLASWLDARQRTGADRWLIHNDGANEIADVVVIETLRTGEVALELWHAKASSSDVPARRVKDAQVVAAQVIRSRRWLTSTALWSTLAARLRGLAKPHATLLPGSDELDALLERLDPPAGGGWVSAQPQIRATVAIAQPGLSKAAATSEPLEGASGIDDLLAVLQDLGAADGFDLKVLGSG